MAQDDGWTPLWDAVGSGDTEVIRALIGGGTDVNSADADGWTPLWLALGDFNPAVVEVLLKLGADVNHRDERGGTPLMFLARKCDERFNPELSLGFAKCLDCLFEVGANVRAVDYTGQGALESATIAGCDAIVGILIDAGADPNRSDADRWSPLMWAARHNDVSLAALLLDRGANIDLKNGLGDTALDIAESHDLEKIVMYLHLRGASTEN